MAYGAEAGDSKILSNHAFFIVITTSSFNEFQPQSQAPEDASYRPGCPLTFITLACNSSLTARLTRQALRVPPLSRYNPHGKLSNLSKNGAGLQPPTAYHPREIIKPYYH